MVQEQYNVASNIKVYISVRTSVASYETTGIIKTGENSTYVTVNYNTGNRDEQYTSVTIRYIEPSTDSTYRYIDCTPQS